MAIAKLPINYKDDVIDTSVNAHRRYKITKIENDVYEFEDKTQYIQKGSDFNSESANLVNSTVNQIIDLTEENDDVLTGIINGETTIPASSRCYTAEKSNSLAYQRTINGVPFDGSKDITIYDNTKLPIDKDFILKSQYGLIFTDNVCRFSDARIKATSLADIYFDADSVNPATNAGITIDTYDGYVEIRAVNTPSQTLVASIVVKAV